MGLELSWLGGYTGGHRPALSLSLSPAIAVPSATCPFGFSSVMAVGLWGLAASSAASLVVLISQLHELCFAVGERQELGPSRVDAAGFLALGGDSVSV